MAFMWTAGWFCFDYKRNLDITKKSNTEPIMQLIENYRTNWKNHVLQMPCHKAFHFLFSVAKWVGDDLWGEPSSVLQYVTVNRPLGLIYGRLMMMIPK
jgi:hypothetical protein